MYGKKKNKTTKYIYLSLSLSLSYITLTPRSPRLVLFSKPMGSH